MTDAENTGTRVEDEAFIGSGTQLVAPVTVKKGAVVGAGSTITGDVPFDAVALSRVRQVNRDGAASRRRARTQQAAGPSSVTSSSVKSSRSSGPGRAPEPHHVPDEAPAFIMARDVR